MKGELISRILKRASVAATIHDMAEGLSPKPSIKAKAGIKDVENAEKKTGLKFPPDLKEILTKIGNGGFGPGYGLFSADEIATTYKELIKNREIKWPVKYLPICTWGCDIYSCVDTSDSNYPVYYFESGDHCFDDASFTIEDADGNLVDSGMGNPFDDDEEDDFGEAAFSEMILHRDSFEDFIGAWADGVKLESEVVSFDEDEDEDEDEDFEEEEESDEDEKK